MNEILDSDAMILTFRPKGVVRLNGCSWVHWLCDTCGGLGLAKAVAPEPEYERKWNIEEDCPRCEHSGHIPIPDSVQINDTSCDR